MTAVWCNGVFGDENDVMLSITDRGFTLADGVFETLLATGNHPLWFEDHLRRLKDTADQLGLFVAYDDEVIMGAVVELLEKAACPQSAIRITLTRGPTSKRGLWVSDNPDRPTLLITCAPAAKPAAQRMIVCQVTRRNEQSPLSRIKSLNYGDNILARREAVGRGATDALMLNGRGNIACATAGNVFFHVGGEWLTPPLSDGILPGLARKRLIAALNVQEQSLRADIVRDVDTAFISNSLGCSPIVEIEGHLLYGAVDDTLLASIYR
ncbi:MAG: aminotransferase class IV [Xanthobacteraceae bacterium]|nr:aminotransferase class IV [Xanthobacteraceae bacterium]